jgi:hypothetical protein
MTGARTSVRAETQYQGLLRSASVQRHLQECAPVAIRSTGRNPIHERDSSDEDLAIILGARRETHRLVAQPADQGLWTLFVPPTLDF